MDTRGVLAVSGSLIPIGRELAYAGAPLLRSRRVLVGVRERLIRSGRDPVSSERPLSVVDRPYLDRRAADKLGCVARSFVGIHVWAW